MKTCEWCDNQFNPSVSYQIYCSPECRENATKEKIVERHKVLRRQKRKSKKRVCANGCGATLSIYNDDILCNNCGVNTKQVEKKIKEIKMLMHSYEDKRKK